MKMKTFLFLLLLFTLSYSGLSQDQDIKYVRVRDFNTLLGSTTTITGAKTFTGNLRVTGTTTCTGLFTTSVLPSFTIAAGQINLTAKDTGGVAIPGLTSSSIVVVSYAQNVAAEDTNACVHTVKAGYLTVIGKKGTKVNYWVPKK
jgi:hypothetical protein